MDSIISLTLFASIMWLLQIIFGWIQINAFNKEFIKISKKGKILIGKNSGRLNKRSIIVLVIDEQKNVIDSLQIKGFSIFARPQKIINIIGLNISHIQPEYIFPKDKKSQIALKIAISSIK